MSSIVISFPSGIYLEVGLLDHMVVLIYVCVCVCVCVCVYLFIYGCVGSSLLRAGFLFSCGESGLLFVAVRGLLIVVAPLVAEHGLYVHGLQ